MGATCAESPVPSVASEELTAGKRWSSLALVMQVHISFSNIVIFTFSSSYLTHWQINRAEV